MLYFETDTPIPFKGDLQLHPVYAKDYYAFHNNMSCLTKDKTVKEIIGEHGEVKKVANIKGISQTYMQYLIECMQENTIESQLLTNQVLNLFELVFQIKKGWYCPKCGQTLTYQEVSQGMDDFAQSEFEKFKADWDELIKKAQDSEIAHQEQRIKENQLDTSNPNDKILSPSEIKQKIEKEYKITSELKEKILLQGRYKYFTELKCPSCGEKMREVFSIKTQRDPNNSDVIISQCFDIHGTELTSQEFDEFKAIVPRQNILDYDGDKYINPDLKEELELKAKLKNKDSTPPTLEKQIVSVALETGYTIEQVKELTLRKLSMFLRQIDRRDNYRAQIQGAYSGMVSFKENPKHWIWDDEKYKLENELTEYNAFESKFKPIL